MPYTLQDFRKDYVRDRLNWLTVEERRAGLTPQELLAGLTVEERRAGLTPIAVNLRTWYCFGKRNQYKYLF